MAMHLIVAFWIVVFWVLSLWIHPFGKCFLCRGRRIVQRGRRAHRCHLCGGAGRRQRFGSRRVHRIRRQVHTHWNRVQ